MRGAIITATVAVALLIPVTAIATAATAKKPPEDCTAPARADGRPSFTLVPGARPGAVAVDLAAPAADQFRARYTIDAEAEVEQPIGNEGMTTVDIDVRHASQIEVALAWGECGKAKWSKSQTIAIAAWSTSSSSSSRITTSWDPPPTTSSRASTTTSSSRCPPEITLPSTSYACF